MRMKKGIVIVGVILLVIGILLTLVSLLPVLTAKSIGDMKEDFNEDTGEFKSYSDGDEIYITGEITEETSSLGVYAYELDNEEFGFSSGEDIGDEGDTVILLCEVKEMSIMGISVETLEAKAVYKPFNIITILGIILLIVGIIVMIVGAKKGAAPVAPAQPPMEQPPYQQPPYQQPPYQQPPMQQPPYQPPPQQPPMPPPPPP